MRRQKQLKNVAEKHDNRNYNGNNTTIKGRNSQNQKYITTNKHKNY